MLMNVREVPASMLILVKTLLEIIDASVRKVGLGKIVTITSMTVWVSASMEQLA